MGTGLCLGRRSVRKLTTLRAIARQVAERAEVDLAVSGLKPDWPPRTATAVRRIVSLQQESR
jgi:hypothetical protein